MLFDGNGLYDLERPCRPRQNDVVPFSREGRKERRQKTVVKSAALAEAVTIPGEGKARDQYEKRKYGFESRFWGREHAGDEGMRLPEAVWTGSKRTVSRFDRMEDEGIAVDARYGDFMVLGEGVSYERGGVDFVRGRKVGKNGLYAYR